MTGSAWVTSSHYVDSPPSLLPQHEQHEEMLQWRGPFDPEAFDLNQATKGMRKVK
jgi:hypothetical protein